MRVEPVEVLGAVELVAARPLGRGSRPFAGVVPDRVDREPGLLGEFVDSPLRFGHDSGPPG